MIPKFKDSGKKLTDELLHAVEGKLHIALPQEYREFLLKYNGGRPRPDLFKIPRGRELFVDEFLSFDEESMRKFGRPDIESELDTFRHLEGMPALHFSPMPEHLLPIAHAGDDLVLLSLSGPDSSKILFWDRVEEGFERDHVETIADSFSQFLERFTYDQESSPWEELIVNGDVDGFRRWLQTINMKKARHPCGTSLLTQCMGTAIDEGVPEIVDILIQEHRADPARGFLDALSAGQVEIAEALLARKPRFPHKPFILEGIQHFASLILWHEEAAPTKRELDGSFALRGVWRDRRLVDLLIKAGADVNCKDPDGRTPLDFAEQYGDPGAVQWLFDRGAKSQIEKTVHRL
jgi:hypothetical protein